MAAALTLGARGRGRTAPNPNVGCIIVRDDRVVGRGWTQPGGRPHAEAMALEQAGAFAKGATLYTTLEPCAHVSPRGPACSDLIIDAQLARVVIALVDPDARTCGQGIERLQTAGIAVTHGPGTAAALSVMAGFLTRLALGRPYITLKLATSLDGQIALADGTSQWITGPQARAHGHLERARHEVIVVGRHTIQADAPKLDVRLAGLEDRSPRRLVLTTMTEAPSGWGVLRKPADVALLTGVNDVLVEGGAQTAAAFLADNLVDRLLLYRAPILIGAGKAALGEFGLSDLGTAHGRWQHGDTRTLGDDRLEVYERVRE
ncbi:bifunctional diaminohydroxyphosphoribosylaminopyrimidine deaminase/5-amino-6-(5-phosphoribosylamino)uracil reductase RibD [Sphingomonas sp. 28-62-11]|uniref:bifunctional diaminohydroxyphosphoribosylaminopyrimidine deaminase/5-amino-6-(5-phosphoribosylamino)uracil reductase RibD n=1 Tax=Sphingomonas sp. 28-62-11 TaxID=1970432 RepID=UPI000BC986D2|nr:MAG: riboflavin biosynthesis protein RibD [Sphingomonas sp. 28-62-11]